MRKNCRSRVRSRGKAILTPATRRVALYAYEQLSERWREWKFRTVSQERCDRLVGKGEAEAVVRLTGRGVEVVGYRLLFPAVQRRASKTTLTRSDMDAVARAAGRAEDVHLSWHEQKQLAKFVLWPFEFDRKNLSTVGPRTGPVEKARALKTLQAA